MVGTTIVARLLVATVVVFLTLDGVAAQFLDVEKALVEAEGRWAARKLATYEMTVEVRCFCGAIPKVPPTFRVADRVATLISKLAPPTASLSAFERVYGPFNTVPRLFATLREYLTRRPHRMNVRYHPDLGYPEFADIDVMQMVFDDELSFRVTDFKPVPR